MQGRRVAAIDEGNDVELPRGKRQIKVQPTRKFCLVAIFPLDCVRPSDQLFCVAFCSVERYSIGGYGVITTSKSSRNFPIGRATSSRRWMPASPFVAEDGATAASSAARTTMQMASRPRNKLARPSAPKKTFTTRVKRSKKLRRTTVHKMANATPGKYLLPFNRSTAVVNGRDADHHVTEQSFIEQFKCQRRRRRQR